VAGIDTFSQLMALVDVKDDGDYKLVIADSNGKLKIYMGTNVIYNEKLSFEKPTAVQFFYDSTKKPMLPIIAVAAGSSLYYYQNYLPYMKFDLPLVLFSQEEKNIWTELNTANEVTFQPLADKLFSLRESGVQLSSISSELLSLETLPEQLQFARSNYTQLIQHQNYITCLSKVNKSLDEEKTVQLLIVGTESKDLYVLDNSGMAIKKKITGLKSVPCFI
jgi:Ciliary BBSome complex subunit 1